jgi:UDP-glucose 4-epimerase
VVDLAQGHIKALERLRDKPGCVVYNLGTGNGYSVLEMIKAFEKASGKVVAYQLVDRRPGDIATCYADPALARAELDWSAKKTLEDMTTDAWRWQKGNPKGYRA